MTKTGYSSPEADHSPEGRGDDVYKVTKQTIASHDPRPCAVILRNGTAFGYIPCDSEEEFEWLKARLTGTRPRF
jgi:hypothetical protein